jgi:hypothetical protein
MLSCATAASGRAAKALIFLVKARAISAPLAAGVTPKVS